MEWVKFSPAWWYRQTRGMSDAEKGKLMDATADAIVDGEKGRTGLADAMIGEAEAYSEGKAKAAKARWKKAKKERGATHSTAKQRNAMQCTRKSCNAKQTNKQTIRENTSEVERAGGMQGGETPTPPAHTKISSAIPIPSSVPESVREALAEAMRGAPLTAAEALDYAAGPHGGLTPQQVLAWAEWNAERGWNRDMGGNLHSMTRRMTEGSLRRWRMGEADFAERRKAAARKDKPISDKGGIPSMDF